MAKATVADIKEAIKNALVQTKGQGFIGEVVTGEEPECLYLNTGTSMVDEDARVFEVVIRDITLDLED